MATSSFSIVGQQPVASAAAPVSSSAAVPVGDVSLSLVPFISSSLLYKTVSVELLSGHRIVGRLASCDPKTMNILIDFIKKTEVRVKVSVPSGAGANGGDSDSAATVEEERWIPNPREFKFLSSIFVRGSSIKFFDFDVDAAHTLLASYPSFV